MIVLNLLIGITNIFIIICIMMSYEKIANLMYHRYMVDPFML